jgi:ABC-2 type transport system permease protein
LDGIRRVLIEGQTLSQVTEPLVTLLVMLLVLLPFSLWVFGRAVRRAKREGSLIQY